MRAFIRTASFLLWPWQLTGLDPAAGLDEDVREHEVRVDANRGDVREVDRLLALAHPLGGVVHDAVRRDQDLGGKEAVAAAEAAGAEHVALRRSAAPSVDPEADERHDQQDGRRRPQAASARWSCRVLSALRRLDASIGATMGSGMKSLASELSVVAEHLAGQPRVYADANVPAGLVGLHAAPPPLGRPVRDRARGPAAAARHRALQAGDPAAPHAADARPRLPGRPALPSGRDGRRPGDVGARRDTAWPRCCRASTGRSSGPRPRRGKGRPRPAAPPLPLEGRKLHVHPDWRPAPAD